MSNLRLNVLANIAAKLTSALLLLFTIPILIRVLGTQSYGLAILFSSGISILASFDFGLGTTLNRELASCGRNAERLFVVAPLAMTLEMLFWLGATAVCLLGTVMAPVVANHWLMLGDMQPQTATRALRLMIAALSLQIPFTLYTSGMLGLQLQVALSATVTGTSMARTLGTLLALAVFGPSIEIYFWCQLVVGIVQAVVARNIFWRSLPLKHPSTRFSYKDLQRVKRFSMDMTGISMSGILLTQMDKIVISRLLPLSEVGYYGVASTAAAAVSIIVSPIFNALFPRLTQAAAAGDEAGAARLYHRASQFLAVLIWPPTCLLVLYAQPILQLWTGNADLSEKTAPALALLAIGGTLNGVMHLPYALQLAGGWTRLALYTNVVALTLLAPGLCIAATMFGLTGAATMWPILNLGYLIIGVHLMHRRLLSVHKWRWYLRDLLAPLLSSAAACLLLRMVCPVQTIGIHTIYILADTYLVASLAALCSATEMRSATAQIIALPLKRLFNK